MRSAARLTYDQAHAALFRHEPAARERLGAVFEALLPLVDVYQALSVERRRRGALDFDAPEAEFVFEDGEHVRGIEFISRNDAHRLIEECMVAGQRGSGARSAATACAGAAAGARAPDDKKLDQLRATLRVVGIELQLPEEVHARDLGAVAPRVRDPELRP